MIIRSEEIYKKANSIVKSCGTRDTLKIARELGIHLHFLDNLNDLLGMYTYRHKERHILLNSNMEYLIMQMVCGHEIGHDTFHRDLAKGNEPLQEFVLFDMRTKHEYEANAFASHLIIDDDEHALVYGGSKTGLMGEIAKSVLDAGGTVTGVETTLFMQDDLQYDGLTELIVTETITERKTEMIRRGDAFIAFPGGTGTLEEIAEVMSKVSLKQLDAPCILYNLNGYYNGLKTLLDHMIETGLSTKERQKGIRFAENLEQIKQILKA